jgi:hypothetical protein
MKHKYIIAAAALVSLLLVVPTSSAGLVDAAAAPAAVGSGGSGTRNATQEAPCAPYCSLADVGQRPPYYGEVSSARGLKAALAARAYKREVVVITSDAARLDSALQAALSLRRVGHGHIVFVATGARACRAVAAAVPDLGCAWLERDAHWPDDGWWGPITALHQAKERLALR